MNWKKGIVYITTTILLMGEVIFSAGEASVNAADRAQVPGPVSETAKIGATMPYTRYDSKAATLGNGAKLAISTDFAKNNIASQASEQSYIRLPKRDAYAQWQVNTTGAGVTMRFTLPDSSDGMGREGSLDVYVNGKKVQTVNLTSYYMWQYFEAPNASNPSGSPKDAPVSGTTACFAFDEVHFRLSTALKKGDVIRVQHNGKDTLEYGVDFLEIEEIPAEIKKPANAYSIADYGADGTDQYDDYGAITKCITQAKKDGKDVYIPRGTYRIGQVWNVNASDIKIIGAGIWYTNIQFTQSGSGKGGISGNMAENVEFCHMYIQSKLRSRYNQNANYKCFKDVWKNCYIHDIWEDHFECGFWMADYSSPVEYSDGLLIANCRVRNNFADGVNFCQGTSNATVYNCSIRNNGDDGLAMWNNNYLGAKDESGNAFCYNTIDFIWRAGAIAVYGGNNHKIYNNYIADTFMASGIHLNTNFDGYKYTNNKGIEISNNILVRCGTASDSWNSPLGAIDISGSVNHLSFTNTYIYNAQHDAIKISNSPSGIVFHNTTVLGCGIDGQTTSGNNPGAVIKYENKNSTKSIQYDGLTYANCPYGDVIYGSRIKSTFSGEVNKGNNCPVTIPAGTNKIISSPITVRPEETTAKQTATVSEKVAQVVVKKVVKKNRKAKSAKITLKKIKGVKGYQVKVSSNKKFKKSKTITKCFSKTSFKVSGKKLVNAKVLYVKARAYRMKGKAKSWGAWSKVKQVKVKK